MRRYLGHAVTLVLFPCDPLHPRRVEPDFEQERDAALQAGLQTALLDHTGILRGAVDEAVARVPEGAGGAVYRGWMLTPRHYGDMYGALHSRGVQLINAPQAYRVCHYLPDSYPFIQDRTPRSVWLKVAGNVDFTEVLQALAPFGNRPVVLKDYVKSQKHYWAEACFIPAADDAAAVQRVVRRFVELQGEDLNEGLVFREYVPLKIVATHPKSGLPLAAEFRTFWLDGAPLLTHRYWGELTAFDAELPLEALRDVAARVPSRFFSMDVAFKDNGDWTIVELGDGQVAGLPAPELAADFFRRLAQTS